MSQSVESKRVALVVDDERMIRNVVQRALRRHFDMVLTAAVPEEADEHLARSPVTHLICDCNLGPDLPLGVTFIPGWCATCHSIERVVLFTGTDLKALSIPKEVDAVVSKGSDMSDMLEALGVGLLGPVND